MSRHGSRQPGSRGKTSAGTQVKRRSPRRGVREAQHPTRSTGARAFRRRALASERKRRARGGGGDRSLTMRLTLALPSFPSAGWLRRVPRAAWICGLVACLSAICWSIVTPAFEVPDEPSHYAYVAELAEHGSIPYVGSETFAQEELFTLVGLNYYDIRQHPQTHAPSSPKELSTLHTDIEAGIQNGESASSAGGVATTEPPLYYAVETVPYKFAGGDVLDRLQVMRLLSSLMAGLTAIFVYLFLREALPSERWAWTVGGLAAALVPVLGFISGAVNPDSLLFAVSAAVFFCLARAFRRSLTTRAAVAVGSLIAIGILTKLNFIGLLPGILLGLILLTLRAARSGAGRSAYARLALALGIGFSPVLLYAAINLLSNRATLGLVSVAIHEASHRSVLGQLDYTWQLFLPRIPGTPNYFPGLFTTRQLWFDDYVGFYGFIDTTFPNWVDELALVPAAGIVTLCCRALWQRRSALRARLGELVVYGAMTLGLLLLIGGASYHHFPAVDAEDTEPRYLLPLLALFGAMLALAARGAGRRWGPVVGVLMVVLFLGHDIFSQLLEAGRFYI